jgi:hypothetical protein
VDSQWFIVRHPSIVNSLYFNDLDAHSGGRRFAINNGIAFLLGTTSEPRTDSEFCVFGARDLKYGDTHAGCIAWVRKLESHLK